MAIERLKSLQGPSRRRFLRWTAAAGALLALDRTEVLNVLNDTGGEALAQEASCASTCRSVHLVAGNGGFAWFQLLWPHTEIALANNNNFAFHAFGQTQAAPDTDNPQIWAPETPWKALDKSKRMTGFMAGQTQIHTDTPTAAANVGGGQSMLAVVSSIQRAQPSLLPVIGIEPVTFGTAPGAPQIATVGSAEGMVELFNSAASQTFLALPEDAGLYEAYYKAFLSLNKASARPTMQRPLRIGKQAANLLGRNLADQLRPTSQDLARYNIDGGTPTKLSEIGRALITATRAFELGLTQSVILPAMRDDPHGAFGNMQTLQSTVAQLGFMLDQFMIDLESVQDPECTDLTLADNVVLTVHGDTPKNPRDRGGWPDGTPNNSNWLYVMGNGYIKTGWFGGVRENGQVDGFDPSTGANVPNQQANVTTESAGAAAAFAVAKGDLNRVQDFYNGPAITGIINENPL